MTGALVVGVLLGARVVGEGTVGRAVVGAAVVGTCVGTEAGIADGRAVGAGDGFGSQRPLVHTPRRQSDVAKHAAPISHESQKLPPQSTSVSAPSATPLVQVSDVGEELVGIAVGVAVDGFAVDGAGVGCGVGEGVGKGVGVGVGAAVVGVGVGGAMGRGVGAGEGDARHSSVVPSWRAILLRRIWTQI